MFFAIYSSYKRLYRTDLLRNAIWLIDTNSLNSNPVN